MHSGTFSLGNDSNGMLYFDSYICSTSCQRHPCISLSLPLGLISVRAMYMEYSKQHDCKYHPASRVGGVQISLIHNQKFKHVLLLFAATT